MRVLGVDPGTATTGYGVVDNDNGNLKLRSYGAILTPAGHPLPERLGMVYGELSRLIGEQLPDAVAVEELFFQKNARTALAVGQARGVVLLAAQHAGLRVYEYTPLQVKDAVVGYGKATKDQVQQMVALLLGLDFIPRPDDAADAIAIAICHSSAARMTQLMDQQ